MARLPDDTIDRLKREVPLDRLVPQTGVALKRRGKDWVGTCPFHEDDTPSLIVTPSKNLFHCMGCGAAGSPIDWVMRTQSVDFRAAADQLVKDYFPLAAQAQPLKEKTIRLDSGDADLIAQINDHYHAVALAAPDLREYLQKRGLDDEAMIRHFKLGYVDRSLVKRVPTSDLKAGQVVRGDMRRLGYLRESGHEHFHGCLTVPIHDADGSVVELYGRKIRDNQRKGVPRHLYLPGPHRGVWNLAGLEGMREVILCEALLDALTFWRHGFRNVTASYGARGFTDAHLEAFKALGIKRVLIAYDRDKPGDDAARELATRLLGEGIAPYRVQFPKGMDANGYALSVQPPRKSLELVLNQAVWMGDGAAPPRGAIQTDAPTSPPSAAPAEPEKAVLKPAPLPTRAAPSSPTAAPAPPAPVSTPTLSLAAKAAGPTAAPLTAPPPTAPPTVPGDITLTEQGEDLYAVRGDRTYRVRGLADNMSRNVMKVNLFAYRGDAFHVDVLNLYSGYHRASFARQAARELSLETQVVEKDLGRLLLRLETVQDERIQATLEPQNTVELSDAEVDEAVALLRDPRLTEHILEDFRACGMIGEETNKLVGYLVATSRKLDQPLGALIQSASASGKSTTMDAVLAFVPEEDKVRFSAITGQSLYYMGEEELKHKVIAIVEEEGAERASYPLKLLLSEGELTIASTGKNDQNGSHATRQYCVKGPVAVMLTTTATETDEEFQNRCLVLAVDETRDHTRAIHHLQRQRKTLEGLLVRERRGAIIRRQQNAQRLLRPLKVVNPFAEALTFLDTRTRLRRDNQKYLNIIECIAFLHQYQRQVQTLTVGDKVVEYIEVTADDVALANRLAAEVLGRTLDELSPQTRNLLLKLHEMVSAIETRHRLAREEVRFTRREVREYTGWSEFQVRTHMQKLLTMEYVYAYHGRRGQSFVYELVYDGEGREGEPFMLGLLDADKLGAKAADPPTPDKRDTPQPKRSKSSLNGHTVGAAAPMAAMGAR